MPGFSRMHRQCVTDESEDGLRLLSVGGRAKVLTTIAIVVLAVGVVTAYGALGAQDTATGTGALASENGGNGNTADGVNALTSNSTGNFNTAAGWDALHSNTTGTANTGAGKAALKFNTSGGQNTAAGLNALLSNTTGNGNTAAGFEALDDNTTGANNTAVGNSALYSSLGDGNTAVGAGALFLDSIGSSNTAVGRNAGAGGTPNLFGSTDTFLGYGAAPGTSGQINNATAVGANALVSQSDSLVLGASGVNVGINNSTPASRLQVGAPSGSFGDYVQLPIVTNTAKTPPPADCNNTTFRGRVFLQVNGKKTTLWACTGAGVWKALAAK